MVYNSNWEVYDVNGKLLDKQSGAACYAGTKQYWTNRKTCKADNIVIYSSKTEISYSNEEIEKYIELINKVEVFKIAYSYDDKNNRCNFTIDPKDYTCMGYFTGATMVVRYLWETCDHFTQIPKYFTLLHEEYPEEDMLYKLMWAHIYLSQDKNCRFFNSNHCLSCADSFPIKTEDLKKSEYTNGIFSSYKRKDYNKMSLATYYRELKELEEVKLNQKNKKNVLSLSN